MAVDPKPLIATQESSGHAIAPDQDVRRDKRTIIVVDDFNFTTMHNVLYYLHTGYVNLHLQWRGIEEDCDAETFPEVPLDYPEVADPLSLYQAASLYMLEDLENRCFRYLSSTCTEKNIVKRLFNRPECAHYDRIRNMYLEYLVNHFEAVKTTKQWEEMLLGMKDCSEDLVAHRSALLFEITRKMSVG